MKQKPRLSFWQIWNMSFGFLGIQFGFALQNANASWILQTFGADVHHLSWFWLVAPITGMIVQPIIGFMSDKTWNRLGRRRPYFLTGAILTSIALILMPNAPHLASFIAPMFIGGGLLMIMDASINISMEPFRALVADKLPEEQHTLGFSMQTLLIGIGAVVGSWLPYILGNWLGVSKEAAHEGLVPPNLYLSFYFGAFVLIASIIWTISTTKEYPPEFYRDENDQDTKETGKKHPKVKILKRCGNSFWSSSSHGLLCFQCGFTQRLQLHHISIFLPILIQKDIAKQEPGLESCLECITGYLQLLHCYFQGLPKRLEEGQLMQ